MGKLILLRIGLLALSCAPTVYDGHAGRSQRPVLAGDGVQTACPALAQRASPAAPGLMPNFGASPAKGFRG